MLVVNSILKVAFGNTLMELSFNVSKDKEEISFTIGITDDGETISFNRKDRWMLPGDYNYEMYSLGFIDEHDELSRLLNNHIKDVQLGITTSARDQETLYYFKLQTNTTDFLFFNNGDEGAYSFDRIDEVLSADIYGCKWKQFIYS